MNHWPFHIGDFNRATRHLNHIEKSIYVELLNLYYDKEQPLLNDLTYLSKRCVIRSDEEKEALKNILLEFFFLENNVWHNTRCDDTIAEYQEKAKGKDNKKKSQRERQERAREKRKALFEIAREKGLSVAWNATTADLEILLKSSGFDLSQDLSQQCHALDTAKPEPKPEPKPQNNCANTSHDDDEDSIKKAEEQALDELFEKFWLSGIRKDNKKKAEPLFKKLVRSKSNWHEFTGLLIDDIKKRVEVEQLGFDLMLPTTYLNGERWNDSIPEKRVSAKLLKLPVDNEKLWSFAKEYGLPEPRPSENYFEYRSRLNNFIQEKQIFQ